MSNYKVKADNKQKAIKAALSLFSFFHIKILMLSLKIKITDVYIFNSLQIFLQIRPLWNWKKHEYENACGVTAFT